MIEVGEEFSENNIVAKRAGGKGVSAIRAFEIIGKKATKNYNENDLIEV